MHLENIQKSLQEEEETNNAPHSPHPTPWIQATIHYRISFKKVLEEFALWTPVVDNSKCTMSRHVRVRVQTSSTAKCCLHIVASI